MKKLLIISLILPLFCFSQYKLPQKLNGHVNESTYNRIIGDSDYVTSLLKQTISNEDWIVIKCLKFCVGFDKQNGKKHSS